MHERSPDLAAKIATEQDLDKFIALVTELNQYWMLNTQPSPRFNPAADH